MRASGSYVKRLTPSSGEPRASRANRHWISTCSGLTSRTSSKFVFAQSATALAQAVLEGALDARVQRVDPGEREGLGVAEARAGAAGAAGGLGAVVAEHAVQEGEAHLVGEAARRSADQLGADREVAEHRPLLADPELGAVGELTRLA